MIPGGFEGLMDDLSRATGQAVFFVNAKRTDVVRRCVDPAALPCARCARRQPQLPCAWLIEADLLGEMCFCPSGFLFFPEPLEAAGHPFGTLAMGPLPLGDHRWLSSMRTVLAACACLARESRLFPEQESLFAELKGYVLAHIAEPLDFQTLSSVFFLSPDTLSRVTRRHAGLPLRRYIQTLRLEHARVLLTGTRLHVQEIAERCGFPDYNYFSRAFRKQYGRTPSSLRSGDARGETEGGPNHEGR